MGIIGLTHSEDGSAIQRLPVSIKIAIGEGPDPNNPKSYPKKLDHFVFRRKELQKISKNVNGQTRTIDEAVWVTHEEVTARYGENPREIGVVFMDNDIENVFRTSYAWFKTNECVCRGEMQQVVLNGQIKNVMQAWRRTEKHPEGEAWPGNYKYASDDPKAGHQKGQSVESCGDGCPDLEAGRCKPSADLYFQLDKFPMFGAICRLHTTSYRSIRQISSALQQVVQTFGGLAGVRMMLKVRPEKGTFEQNGEKKSTTMYILSLELDAQDWTKLIANATEMKQLFQNQKKMLGPGRIVIEEDDTERASEIAGEFYTETVDGEQEASAPATPAIQQPKRISESAAPAAQTAPAEALKPPRAEIPTSDPNPTSHAGAQQTLAMPSTAVSAGLISKEQKSRLIQKIADEGWGQVQAREMLKSEFGVDKIEQLHVGQFDKAMDKFSYQPLAAGTVFQAGDEDLPENMR